MTLLQNSRWLRNLAMTGAICGFMLTGCGEQDLYEPPGSPYSVVGTLPLFSDCESVAVLGNHAYVAGGQAGIYVIDISAPDRPTLKQILPTDTESDAFVIEVMRTMHEDNFIDIAFLNEGAEGIHPFNISNPDSCFTFEGGTTGYNTQNFFIEQTAANLPALLYMADSRGGIKIFQSLPESPENLYPVELHIDIDRRAMAIDVKNGFAYVACDQLGLTEVDVRTPSAAEVTGWSDTPGNALDVELQGDYAFVADGTEGLAVFRIVANGNPELIAAIDLSGYSRAIAIRDNLACLAAAGGGTHFIDIANPENPIYLGTIVSTYATDVAIANNGLVHVSDRFDGLLILGSNINFSDTSPPAAIVNLKAEPYTTSHVALSWTAMGDDGALGRATSYDLRWSTEPIVDEATWDNATRVTEPLSPDDSGSRQSYIVSQLPAETTCYFALKSTDDAGHVSGLSNAANATTLGGIVLLNPRVDPIEGSDLTTEFTFKIDYNQKDDSPPTLALLVVDGSEGHSLSLSDEDTGLPGLHTYEVATALSTWGIHRYRFRCDDALGNSVITPDNEGPVLGRIFFDMGSPSNELGRKDDETLHRVVLRNFIIPASTEEVTQQDWENAGFDLPVDIPTQFRNPENPVVNINWYDAVAYCNQLSDDAGLTRAYDTSNPSHVVWNQDADGWRLPTESEWEYLCRAGTVTALSDTSDITIELSQDEQGNPDPHLDLLGWYHGNSERTLHAGAAKASNAFGLHDMHGNVAEWCWDYYGPYPEEELNVDLGGPTEGTLRVIRGGHWDAYARDCRSAARGYHYPNSGDDYIGFRVVRNSDEPWPPSR